MKEIPLDFFSEETRWQSWLDVEAILALSQAKIGMIPKEAAEKIAATANLGSLDLNELRNEISSTMAPVFALSECLARKCGEHGAYVHWGATTRNIIDTGRLIVLRRVNNKIRFLISEILLTLANQAAKHHDLPMIGRTNLKDALPITLGFKIASWIDELLRVLERLDDSEKRLFQLRFGGAIGGYNSFDGKGFELSKEMSRRLNFKVGLVPSRSVVDPMVEYMTALTGIGFIFDRLASDCYLLMSTSINEVVEKLSKSVVGSSTMPHKINPKLAVQLKKKSTQLKSTLGVIALMPTPTHEGDGVANQYIDDALDEACLLTLQTLEVAKKTIKCIEPNYSRIQENLNASREVMASEQLMMILAAKLGRSKAHHIIRNFNELARKNNTGLQEIIQRDQNTLEIISNAKIAEVFSDKVNTGQCSTIALEASAAAKLAAKNISDSKLLSIRKPIDLD